MTTSHEALQLELGKAILDYQSSFVEERDRESKYNSDVETLDNEYDHDHQRILAKRNHAINHLASLMEIATGAAEGKDVILAKLTAEPPSKQKVSTAAEMLKMIRSKNAVRIKFLNTVDFDEDLDD